MTRLCDTPRKSYGDTHRCTLDLGHRGKRHYCRCGVGWGSGNENYTGDKMKGRAFHAQERLMARRKVQTTLHVLRERSGLSQRKLGKMVGRQQPEISMWEWGKEPLPQAMRYLITGALRRSLPVEDTEHLQPDDLDRPWDEVLIDWKERAQEARPA